ncbi:MAG: leucine-rich repeat domain-containing protein [Ignavibacteriae bacterium]|nr:leucine-rich repeat domain-containing protein [Ignavibacteriota bacterium]
MKTLKILYLLIFIAMLFAKSLTAQTLHISGNISTKTEVVKNAKISFIETDDTSKRYEAFSDEFGNYNIDVITSVESTKNQLPTKFELGQNYPNPFSSETAISYKLKENSDVSITIYDMLGREVKKYHEGQQNAGVHGIIWDGRNSIGEKVATGIYFYRLKTGKETIVNKMLLSREADIKNSLSLNHHFVSASELKKESGKPISFKLKIENTANTEPRIAWKKIDNLPIENDTTINISVNKLPIAKAGEDDSVKVGQYVTLDGSQSKVGDGDVLYYDWIPDSTNPAEVRILWSEIQPNVAFSYPGTYKFSLVVNDGIADSEPDEVLIEVGERGESKFEDAVLEAYIRFELKDPKGELTKEKLESMTSFNSLGIFGDVTSLIGIENCINFEILNLSSNKITDLEPLSSLTKLEELNLNQNRILADISPLANLINLKILDLSTNIIADISPLKNLTQLTFLSLAWNPITDIAALEGMTELRELYINYSVQNGPKLKNTHVISRLTKLETLWVGDYDIEEISFVSTLTNCDYMSLNFNTVSDITGISNCNKLYKLKLDNNNLTDITPLEEGMESLKYLDLADNQITNIEPLVKNTNFGQGDLIFINRNPLDEISKTQYIPELRNRGVVVSF